ncbi:MAG: hypothetical protein RLZZ234_564 [Candidatus Parcubacteria bacterium]|jgi:rhodanese-related sulfurtransferase
MQEISVGALHALCAQHEAHRLVDVREKVEFDAGHVAGAEHMPLGTFSPSLCRGSEALYVMCASGGRSARAISLLAEVGIRGINVTGGMSAWVRAGYPVHQE